MYYCNQNSNQRGQFIQSSLSSWWDEAQDSDLEDIIDIYNHQVLTSMSTFAFEPIDVDSRRAWLEALQEDNYPCIVAEINGERDVRKTTIGWCNASQYRPRDGYNARDKLVHPQGLPWMRSWKAITS